MAWVEGVVERTFVVDAPLEKVASFFCDPAQFQAAFGSMEKSEEVEDGVWNWTLEEKSEKGITFQGIYKVKYVRDGDSVTWETLEGNVRSNGTTRCRDIGGDRTEVVYNETMQTDLPIHLAAARTTKRRSRIVASRKPRKAQRGVKHELQHVVTQRRSRSKPKPAAGSPDFDFANDFSP